MRYENLSRYTDAEFKRLVGVTRELFDLMVDILALAEQQKKVRSTAQSESGGSIIVNAQLFKMLQDADSALG